MEDGEFCEHGGEALDQGEQSRLRGRQGAWQRQAMTDRSNGGVDVDAALRHWVCYVVGPRTSINVALDWTEFDADSQATIMLSLLTRHGRATPLMWLTVDKSTLKNHRNEFEYQVLVRLAEALPANVTVCI